MNLQLSISRYKRKRSRTTQRQRSITSGMIDTYVTYVRWYTPINKFNSKRIKKKFSKPIIPHASIYKLWGYKDLDEYYQVTRKGKYRDETT